MIYDIRFKRCYAPAADSDGARVLVDRLWPRGKRKDELELTEWYRDAAPSAQLRRAFHQGGMDAVTFARGYAQELQSDSEVLVPLMRHAREGRLTLLSAVRDPQTSYLAVLREALETELEREDFEADGREPASPSCYGR